MSYESVNFTVLGEDGKPFSPCSQEAIDLLEGITAADKGQAVPYLLLWEVDTRSGKAMHPRSESDPRPKRPLSIISVEPPRFGVSVNSATDVRFRERPPVSLERLSVKTAIPYGIFTYSELNLSFVVHQPDIIFDDHVRINESGQLEHAKDSTDSWSSLVTPGETFALEYGWSASNSVKNGILNGEGFSNPNNGVIVPGRRQIRFRVDNYTFQILPDGQVRFNIHGLEAGEFNTRQAFLIDDKPKLKGSGTITSRQTGVSRQSVDPYGTGMEALLKELQNEVGAPSTGIKNKKTGGYAVPFGLLFDVVFADVIKQAHVDMGFEKNEIFIGHFNATAGRAAPKYSDGVDMSNKPISDFTIPLDDIQTVFARLLKAGAQLTLKNFIEPFLKLFSDQSTWVREPDGISRTMPQVVFRNISRTTRSGKTEMFFYIFDVKREFTKFDKTDSGKLTTGNVSRSAVKKIVTDKGIPFLSFVRANSYVKDATFDVIQDEQMKGIFIRKYFQEGGINRAQKTGSPDVAGKQGAPLAQQIFSAAINGKVTMIGNFAFDLFALSWVDFGIRRWDGPFTIFGKEDVIERGSFTTTIDIQSAGGDPLGTQSR